MPILQLHTNDYILTVSGSKVHAAFEQAYFKNETLLIATHYDFMGGAVNNICIATAENEKLKTELRPINIKESTYPVFFENRDYLFDVEFNIPIEEEPLVYTPLEEIGKVFICRKINDHYFITGTINYKNEIGKTSFNLLYKKNGIKYEHVLVFEVFPVKLDYKNDYNAIITDINNEFSGLVLQTLKKTYKGYKIGDELFNDIVWWNVFGGLYKEILSSAKIILNKPHNKLVAQIVYVKADQIRQMTLTQEEYFAEHKHDESKYYRQHNKTLTIDTTENRFFKYVMIEVFHKFRAIKTQLLCDSNIKARITAVFKNHLDSIEKDFNTIVHHSFFKQIGTFKGMKQESLVLQRALGYESVFRAWNILKRGISFQEGVNKIELKSMDELYQIWCFLEMKHMIEAILKKEPLELNLAEILITGFSVTLMSGNESRVSYKKDNGDYIELFHDFSYANKKQSGTRSYTVLQKPDIVLRITKNDLGIKQPFTYLFDAKYRIDATGNIDSPPHDAINQMHRYRDAIYYQGSDNSLKKEVVGAYVLFPGNSDPAIVEDSYYHRSIKEVNIGAFPLLPGSKRIVNNCFIKDFLSDIIENKSSVSILKEDIVPYKGLKYEHPDGQVLAGFISKEEQRSYFLSDNAEIYHTPAINIKHLNQLKYFAPIMDGIRFYFEIESIQILPRKDIFDKTHPLYKDSKAPYYVFKLINRVGLKRAFTWPSKGNRVFQYITLSKLYALQ